MIIINLSNGEELNMYFNNLRIFSVELSGDLHYFETLKTADINRRVRRSVDPHPSAHLHEIWFSSLGR